MEKYEEWMKQWKQFKHTWIDSSERVTSFVVHAVPPKNKYTTMLHYELSLEIERYTGTKTKINQSEKCIEIHDGSPLRPSIYFHPDDVSLAYPWSVSYSMRVDSMTADNVPLQVLDRFGFVSLKLNGFQRITILQIVKAMKNLRFGVLHGVIDSCEGKVGGLNTRYLSKLPDRDDPVWLLV